MLNDAVRRYQAEIGARGGAAGTGESKRRSASHYRRIAALGVAARLRKWSKAKGGALALASLKR